MNDIEEKNISIVTSCYSGTHKQEPKLLSAVSDNYVPEKCNVTKYDAKCSSKSLVIFTLDHTENRSGIIMPCIIFEFPDLIATTPNACVGYCPLPAVNIIDSLKIFSSDVTFEVLNSLSLLVAIKKTFKENYEYIAENWLGQIDGKNQQIEFCEKFSRSKVIKKGFRCILPLPFDLFRNEELYRPDINKNNHHPLRIQISFKEICNILTYNRVFHSDVPKSDFQIKVYTQDLILNSDIFNNCNHIYSNRLNKKAYIAANQSLECNLYTDLSFKFKELPTTEYFALLTSEYFNSHNWFLGNTNESARANWWASMLKPNYEGITRDVLVIKTAQFSSKSGVLTDKHSPYTVIERKEKSFVLEYETGSDEKSYTVISFDIPLSDFPDTFCLDLFHYKNSFETMLILKPQYFSHVHFKLEKFDKHNTNHLKDTTNSDGALTDAPNAYFHFKINSNDEWVFTEVNNMIKSQLVNDELYDIAASAPISLFVTNSLPYINKKFLYVNKMYWPYYDLNGNHPIKIESLKIAETIIAAEQLELEKHIQTLGCKFNLNEFQLYILKNYKRNNKNSHGFSIPKSESIQINLEEIFLIFDIKKEKLDDHLSTNKMKLNLYIIQSFLKHLKYKENQPLTALNKRDYAFMAKEVIENETDIDGIFSNYHFPQKIMEQDDEHLINITTKQASFKRPVYDDYSNNNNNNRRVKSYLEL